MKKLVVAVLVLFMLPGMITVSASTGSIDNPLITLSYLNGTFADALNADIAGVFEDAMNSAMSRLDDIYRNHIGYSFTPRFMRVSLAEGDTAALSSGGSFILLTGSATLTVTSGTVINISTGNEVISGRALTQNQRYFCTENTTAVVTAGTAATGQIDGYYLMSSGTGPSIPRYVFIDVSENDWFFTAVDYVYTNELFAGTSSNTFSPGTPMTRGMFVTVLHRLEGRPEADPGDGFTDVSNPALYYYDAVIWANANRIVTGYEDSTFRPDRSVTREEMAAIMHRYASHKGRDMLIPDTAAYDAFPDNDAVSAYAVAAMRWAVSREIIRGSNGRLLPRNTATRAEVAQIIYNYCERVG